MNNFENINLNNNGGLSFTVNQENPVENIFKKLAESNKISDENKSVKPTAWKVSKYGVFPLSHFPVFGLNTKIYFVNLSIQSKCRKIRTRKKSAFRHVSSSDHARIGLAYQKQPKKGVEMEDYNFNIFLKFTKSLGYAKSSRPEVFCQKRCS